MNSLTYNFNLYVTPNISVPPVLNLSQYDSTRTFIAHLKNDKGEPYLLTSGVIGTVNGKNKRGPFSIDAICKNDTVTFTPSGRATLESGRIYTTIQLVDGEDYLTPLALIFNIQRSAIQGNSGEDGEEIPGSSTSTIILENMNVSLEDNGETLVFKPRSESDT